MNVARLRMRFGLAVLAVMLTMGGAATAQVLAPTPPPEYPHNHIYPEIDQAQADIKAGLAEARRTHKRVILDFGGDWCPDCQVLNIYFHQSPNKELMAKYFVLVDVNIGRKDANLEIAHKYGVPVTGVPAMAVVDGHGRVIYAQTKEFSDMRHLDPQSLTDFLNKWKP
jgi:thioredoxin 1